MMCCCYALRAITSVLAPKPFARIYAIYHERWNPRCACRHDALPRMVLMWLVLAHLDFVKPYKFLRVRGSFTEVSARYRLVYNPLQPFSTISGHLGSCVWCDTYSLKRTQHSPQNILHQQIGRKRDTNSRWKYKLYPTILSESQTLSYVPPLPNGTKDNMHMCKKWIAATISFLEIWNSLAGVPKVNASVFMVETLARFSQLYNTPAPNYIYAYITWHITKGSASDFGPHWCPAALRPDPLLTSRLIKQGRIRSSRTPPAAPRSCLLYSRTAWFHRCGRFPHIREY